VRPAHGRRTAPATLALLASLALGVAAGAGGAPAPAAVPRAPAARPGATAAAPRRAAPTPAATPGVRTPLERAREARLYEDAGAWSSAVSLLRALRASIGPDADLELALALDEARAGAADSAHARLHAPLLTSALADTGIPARRAWYGGGREDQWIDGVYGGWSWYVARARAEVDAGRGRWSEARDAARLAVAARPLAGKEWLVLAVCAGRAGDPDEAGRAAARALELDPSLPEAHYLAGLFEWRAGRRAAALERFGAAVALDSLFELAVRARQHLRFFPGAAPDSLPAVFLTGTRLPGLLTTPVRPRLESYDRVDTQAFIVQQEMVPVPDSLQTEIKPLRIVIPILVDERGRPVLHEMPWFPAADLPAPFVRILTESVPSWKFSPATRSGQPVLSWTAVSITTGSR